jgi:hypothetical protein
VDGVMRVSKTHTEYLHDTEYIASVCLFVTRQQAMGAETVACRMLQIRPISKIQDPKKNSN